jgi:hypothetical protein
MFNCGVCNGTSRPGEKAAHAVIERRADGSIVREALAHGECARSSALAGELAAVARPKPMLRAAEFAAVKAGIREEDL